MSDKTIRIRTTPNSGDNYVKVNLEQDFDIIEILSLKITQEEAYRTFCSDYGVVAGRVIVNSGFGVPNAKVSLFIPIDDVDKNNPEIKDLYPYEVVTDKDEEGIRYNLLAKCAETDNDCFTPIGTFPSKREVLDNENMSYIYCKYYKFTCTTNHAGDFMIFGVPLGYYTLHVDVDISDIGILSQRPYDAISQGTPQRLFKSPTKYRGGNNLDSLVQVKSANVGVNVQPFWGDKDSCQIGISRVDVDLNTTIVPCAMFMGGLFGDQEKNSVNKRCKPRKDMGKVCEQIVSEGTIEMIRENIYGEIESFDIEGGRVIDENGAWAYQIPMNLDYVVTDEEGNLIPSSDPNIGIPTRSNVRFRVGMDQTGSEGRLRTRAKYLIPNNPSTTGEIDYEFGELTKKSSLRNIYWNKIYSVKNFISRYQSNTNVKDKQRTGIKDVDGCVGDKNPFPFNRLVTNSNPLFTVLCIIIQIIAFIIWVINKFLVPLQNTVIKLINFILGVICNLIWGFGNFIDSLPSWAVDLSEQEKCDKFCINRDTCCDCKDILPYVPCIYVTCPTDSEGKSFAPGCWKCNDEDDVRCKGWYAAQLSGNEITYYPGGPNVACDDNSVACVGNGTFDVGLADCISLSLAEALNIYQFDFYNDWINGSLYLFLLKYKKKRRGTEKFCEYDCDTFGIDSGGVDGNNNGVPDNNCASNYLADTGLFSGINPDSHEFMVTTNVVREGLIKKYKGEFYYASTTHDVSKKLFATDLIFLGSVFDCDWQGVPKIQQYLIPTTYLLPPATQELTISGDSVEVTGQVQLDAGSKGLFFSVNCKGLHANATQVLNIRHICEFGVELDELRDINNVSVAPDGLIGLNDIDEDYSKFVRNVFYGLNNATTWATAYNSYDTNFNLKNSPLYNFAGQSIYPVGTGANGVQYLQFRGYQTNNDISFSQPKNSFYFYFGMIPGASGLDKLNQRFFTPCEPEAPCLINLCEQFFAVIDSVTPATTSTSANGKLVFHIDGGNGPFSYTITGPTTPAPGSNIGLLGPNVSTSQITVNNLKAGVYTLRVTDANSCFTTQNFTIGQPGPLYATAVVTQCTTSAANDGQITITNIGGGTAPYSFKLYKHNGGQVSVGGSVNWVSCTQGYVITGLGEDYLSDGATPVPHNGYKLVVKDSSNTQVNVYDLVIDCVTLPTLTPKTTNVTCCNGSDGKINLVINGGTAPFSISTTGPNNYESTSLNMVNLKSGTYTTTVVDSLGYTTSLTNTLSELHPCINLVYVPTPQCDPTKYVLKYKVTSGFANNTQITFQKNLNNQTLNGELVFTDITPTETFVNNSTAMTLEFPPSIMSGSAPSIRIRVKSTDGACFSNAIVHNGMDIALPPNVLSINTTGIDNSVQDVENQVTFKFNISHFAVNNSRAPYTVVYNINGYSGPDATGSNVVGPSVTASTNVSVAIETSYIGFTAAVPQVNGLPAQSCYVNLKVYDSKGCLVTSPIGPINIVPIAKDLTLKVTSKDIKCCGGNDGQLQITASEGMTPYIFSVTGPNGYSLTNNSGVFTNLYIGDYNITVTDSSGIVKTQTQTIGVIEGGYPCLTINPVPTPSCVANVMAFKYTILGLDNNSLGQTFKIEYMVNNNGNWVISENGGSIQTLSDGYPFSLDLTTLGYEIESITSISFRVLIDGNPCTNTPITITQTSPYWPPTSELTGFITLNAIKGADIYTYNYEINVSGGEPNYSITNLVNGNNVYSLNIGNPVVLNSPFSIIEIPNNRPSFTVTVTDNKGCSITLNSTDAIDIN